MANLENTGEIFEWRIKEPIFRFSFNNSSNISEELRQLPKVYIWKPEQIPVLMKLTFQQGRKIPNQTTK